MKKLGIIVVGIAIIMMLSPAIAKVVGTKDEEVMKIADPILDNILEGMKTDNYTLYSKDFDQTMKDADNEKGFHRSNFQINDRIGEYQSRKYLGFINQDRLTIVLYKGSFSGTKDDVLIKLVLRENEKGKAEVSGLWFQ
ncbi:DUF3887 domain-containing protein [bacterium]|nr:DUF3887 domain-containing protein [bacterium]